MHVVYQNPTRACSVADLLMHFCYASLYGGTELYSSETKKVLKDNDCEETLLCVKLLTVCKDFATKFDSIISSVRNPPPARYLVAGFKYLGNMMTNSVLEGMIDSGKELTLKNMRDELYTTLNYVEEDGLTQMKHKGHGQVFVGALKNALSESNDPAYAVTSMENGTGMQTCDRNNLFAHYCYKHLYKVYFNRTTFPGVLEALGIDSTNDCLVSFLVRDLLTAAISVTDAFADNMSKKIIIAIGKSMFLPFVKSIAMTVTESVLYSMAEDRNNESMVRMVTVHEFQQEMWGYIELNADTDYWKDKLKTFVGKNRDIDKSVQVISNLITKLVKKHRR